MPNTESVSLNPAILKKHLTSDAHAVIYRLGFRSGFPAISDSALAFSESLDRTKKRLGERNDENAAANQLV